MYVIIIIESKERVFKKPKGKKIKKKLKKTLDKLFNKCYNNNVNKNKSNKESECAYYGKNDKCKGS